MRFGNYEITADRYNFILHEWKPTEKVGAKSAELKVNIGYYSTYEALQRAIKNEEMLRYLQRGLEAVNESIDAMNESLKVALESEGVKC